MMQDYMRADLFERRFNHARSRFDALSMVLCDVLVEVQEIATQSDCEIARDVATKTAEKYQACLVDMYDGFGYESPKIIKNKL